MAREIGCDGKVVPLKVRTLKETILVSYEVMTSQMAPLLGAFAAFSIPLYVLGLIASCFRNVDNPTFMLVLLLVLFYFVTAIVPRALAHVTSCHFLGQKTSVREILSVSLKTVPRVLATMLAFLVVWFAWCFLLGVVAVVVVFVSIYSIYGHEDLNRGGGLVGGLMLYVIIAIVLVGVPCGLYLRARYAFIYIVAAVEPLHWGFSAFRRSAELMKGLYIKLVLAVLISLVCTVPLVLLRMGIDWTLEKAMAGSSGWIVLTVVGGVIFMALAVVVEAAVGVFFLVFYFSSRCLHAKDSRFDHETLAAIIHGTEISGVEFGYSIVGLESEHESSKGNVLDP